MANFITPADLKAYPLPVTAKQWGMVGDDQIQIVIGFASEHLEDYMDRKILPASYTDRRRGTGKNTMLLSQYPVISMSSAYSYDLRSTESTLDIEDFYVEQESGILEFVDKYRNSFNKSVIWKFSYTAGYASVPGPIKHATALQAVKMLQPMFRGGTNFAETELISDLDEQIVELLDVYKRRRIG